MNDQKGRTIEYLRISVTDRCNFRCRYCMPEEGVKSKSHNDILSFEEILFIVQSIAEEGINKIRITGGEPLVRKGIVGFVEDLKNIKEIKDISITTNASLLEDHAKSLKKAGLERVNISLDTLDESKFKDVTRRGNLKAVKKGIEAAFSEDLQPVKINCVLTKGFNDDEINKFVELAYKYPLHVRFIELMPLGDKSWYDNHFISSEDIIKQINFELKPIKVIKGNGPAKYYKPKGALGTIGFITPISNHFCSKCNRIRLTADGTLKPCLESDEEFDLKKLIRSGGDKKAVKEVFNRCVLSKPIEHNMVQGKYKKKSRAMSQIGG